MPVSTKMPARSRKTITKVERVAKKKPLRNALSVPMLCFKRIVRQTWEDVELELGQRATKIERHRIKSLLEMRKYVQDRMVNILVSARSEMQNAKRVTLMPKDIKRGVAPRTSLAMESYDIEKYTDMRHKTNSLPEPAPSSSLHQEAAPRVQAFTRASRSASKR